MLSFCCGSPLLEVTDGWWRKDPEFCVEVGFASGLLREWEFQVPEISKVLEVETYGDLHRILMSTYPGKGSGPHAHD